MFTTFAIFAALAAMASANTGLNFDSVLPLPSAGNDVVDILGANSLFLMEPILGNSTGITYAYVYTSSFSVLLLVTLIFLYLCGKTFRLHRNPTLSFLMNFLLFCFIISNTIATWFLPSLTNVYFFTLTAIMTALAASSVVYMLYALIVVMRRYRKVRSMKVALQGQYALVSGDTAISLCRPEVFIVVTKRNTDSQWNYDGVPLPTLEPLVLATGKGCYNYERVTDTSSTHSTTKAKMFRLSKDPCVDLGKLSTVTVDDL